MPSKSVAVEISRAIKENKWLDISYDSVNEKRETKYWIFIRDIDIKGKEPALIVDIFNSSKGLDALINKKISFNRILSARRIDFTCGEDNLALIEKIEKDPLRYSFLHYESFDNNILQYLLECAKLSEDPYQMHYQMVEGIDLKVLLENRVFQLNDKQTEAIVSLVYNTNLREKENQTHELAVSDFSIDIGGKKYVVAYYDVRFNPSDKTLRINKELKINRSFLIEKRQHTIDRYIDMAPEDFVRDYPEHKKDFQVLIQESFHHGEKVDTRPDMMVLERDMSVNLGPLYDRIEDERRNGTLEVPMKAFFGDISRKSVVRRKEPKIVIYNNKINIDQVRVLYNALKYPVTYVQGPPGTGKTQTLFNVVVSAYFNEKKILVCTNNNIPVDGIVEKLIFHYRDQDIPFPFLRLGNREKLAEATLKIRELFQRTFKGEPDQEKIQKIVDKEAAKNEELTRLLGIYENRLLLKQNIDCAKKIYNSCPHNTAPQLEKELRAMADNYHSMPAVTNEQVLELFSPASESRQYLQYLYYSSIEHLQRLQKPRYAKLKEIVFIEDVEERVRQFNSWCKDPDNGDENIKLLTDVFPIIFTTNISANHLGTATFKFDLVLMDEAGQCEIAHSLIPLARAKNLLLVGDVDQLQPVIPMDPSVNAELRGKYHIRETYDYCKNSIIKTMQEADNISKRVLLRYHYRSGKKIINFSNKYFYNGKLKLDYAPGEGQITMKAVDNKKPTPMRNASFEEANAIVDYVKTNGVHDTVIITPFNNQKYVIDTLLQKAGINDVTACTVHSMQGAEAKTVILSSAITNRTSPKTFQWLKNSPEIANVAVTRAQQKLILFGDPDAIKNLSTGDDVWSSLVAYAKSNGTIEVIPPQTSSASIGLSNASVNEDEFYKTMVQLCSVEKNFTVKRNVKVKDLFPDDPLLKDSKMEFDSVIYHKRSFLRKEQPFIAFEINGGEHVGDAKRAHADAHKRLLCSQKRLKLVTIGNNDVKNYECMREMISKMNNQPYEQILLNFDEPELSAK